MLRFAVSVYICVHNRHLYMSVVESLLYLKAFKTRYVLAELQTNQAGWLFIAHVFFFITSKLWISVKVFLQECLATSAHDEVAAHNM